LAGSSYLYSVNNDGESVRFPSYRSAGDIYWNDVDLLINAESGNFDKSINNTLTVLNQATLSSFSKHGDYSYYFDGGDQIRLAFNSTTTVLQNICTIDFWVNLTSLSGDKGILCHEAFGSNPDLSVIYNSTSTLFEVTIRTSTGTYTASSNASPQLNTWHHVAIVRNDITLTVYLDGTAGAPVTVSGNFITAQYWGFGVNTTYGSPKVYLTGYLDDIRLTNNVARFRTNFTPSVYPAAVEVGDQQVINLSALTDVTLTGVTSGQTLVYNNGTWVNGYPVAASIDDMPDVTISSASINDHLIYNGTQWVNTQVNSSWFIASDGGDFNTGTVASEGNYLLNGGVFT